MECKAIDITALQDNEIDYFLSDEEADPECIKIREDLDSDEEEGIAETKAQTKL